MQRFLVLLAAALVASACGGDDGAPAAPTVTTAPSATPAPSGTPAPGDTAAPQAPDFELGLFGGDTFSLGAEAKPVYMVFWAEW